MEAAVKYVRLDSSDNKAKRRARTEHNVVNMIETSAWAQKSVG